MKDICRIIVDHGGYRLAWVGFAEDNPERIVRPVAHWGYEDGYLEVLNLTWADTERGRGPTGSAIRNGAPSVFQNILTNPDYGFWREEALKRGYASAVAMPLKEEGRTFGALSVCAATLKEGLEKVKSGAVDVVFLDVRMPDGNGLEVLPEIQASSGEPEVIISTGYGDADGAELAIKSGAWDYIEKSSSAKAIHLSLTRALQYRKEKKTAIVANAVRVLRRVNIIGDSPQIHACLDMVAQAAVSDINVLITGETGTGKELFAQAIHNNSARAKSSFVVVDCAALPDTLVESLLFGHVKGSFTGADKDREGLIRKADGGTLFLDEVGELPLVLQKAFLRVLQEHRFRPVGSKSEVKSDFRLVAATNRRLETMATEGTFRKDLLYRISVFALDLPPLQERLSDMKRLARFQTNRLCERHGHLARRA